MSPRNFIDLAGQTIAGFSVLSQAKSKNGRAYWNVRHRCGGEWVVAGAELRKRPPRSCANCRPTSLNLYRHHRRPVSP